MAILSRPRFLPQQRLDLEGVNALLSALRTDSKLYTKHFLSENNLIYEGFSVSGIGLTSATITMADATLIIAENTNDFSWFVSSPTESNIIISAADLTDSDRNYVELELETENNTPLSAAFWDPDANSGDGLEFSQIVDTMTDLKINVVVSTGGFSGNSNRVPLCILDVDGSGVIKSIFDQRRLFGRLATPSNLDNDFSWSSKVEPVYQLILTGGSGTFIANEQISIGTETATVVTGGTTSITFNSPTGINFFPGDTVTGNDSGASRSISTVSESFIGVDKSLKNQKNINDAQMTEIKSVKGTRYWWQDAPGSLTGIFQHNNSIIIPFTATTIIAWNVSNFSLTDGNLTPNNSDVLAKIRLFGSSQELSLTRQDGTGGSSVINIDENEILYLSLPDSGDRTYSGVGSGNTNYKIVTISSFVQSDSNYWLAYREGGKLYVRGNGELESGETAQVGDSIPQTLLTSLGLTDEASAPSYTSTNFISQGSSFVSALSTLDDNLVASGGMKLLGGGNITNTTSGSAVTASNATGGANQLFTSPAEWGGQSFTAVTSGEISSVIFNLKKTGGTLSGFGYVRIYTDNGSGRPSTTVLATSDLLDFGGLTTSFTAQTFTFASTCAVTAGVRYHAVVVNSGITFGGGANLSMEGNNSNPYAGGLHVATIDSGANWSQPGSGLIDLIFTVNVTGTSCSLAFTLSMYLEVKGLHYTDNTILASQSPLVFSDDYDAAYVIPHLTGSGNLTVVIDSLNNVPKNAVVIARREGSEIIVGTSSNRFYNGQTMKLYDAANASLSNLRSPAVNVTLIADSDDTRALGTIVKRWSEVVSSVFHVHGSTGGLKVERDTVTPSGVNLTAGIVNITGATRPIGMVTTSDSGANANPTLDLQFGTGNKTGGTGDSGSMFFTIGTSLGGARGHFVFDGKYTSFLSILQMTAATDSTLTGADQDASVTTSFVRFTNASLTSIRTINNISLSGQLLILTNATGAAVTIRNQAAAGTAANKIITGTGADLVMPDGTSLWLAYDLTTLRWRIVGGSGGGSFAVQDTRAAPQSVVAGTGIVVTALQSRNLLFIQGSGGAVTVTANPQIPVGTQVGQEMKLVGRSDTNTVTLSNGTGLSLNGSWTGGADDIIDLFWDGSVWVESNRSN